MSRADIPNASRRLALDSLVISGFTGLGVLAGFAVDVLIAARFGLGHATDAYFVAATLPVVILAAVTSSCQGVLVVALAGQSPSKERFFSTLLNLAGLSGLLLALLGTLGSPLLMRLLAPGFDAGTLDTAIRMSRILFWCVPAMLASELLRDALYARSRFGAASMGNLLPGLATLAVLLAWPQAGAERIAWAIVLGSWVGLAWMILVFIWLRVGRYRPVIAWRDPAVRQVGAELTAPLVGLLFRQGVTLAERWFGSFLPPGSVSALGYAGKVTQVLAGTVFGGVATAGLPALASALANGQQQETAWRWRSMLRLSVAAAVPLGLGLALLSRPFVRLLFENSSRNLESGNVILLANVMAIYALSLIPLGPFRAQQSYLFAARRANWVAGLLFLATIITLVLDWLLVKWLGAIGLGLAFTFGVGVSLAVGFVMVKKASPTS